MPGLINCHTHAPMVILRGVAEDVPTDEWFNDYVWPIESNLTEKDVELGARLACAEMLRGGVTTFADHYFSMDVVAGVVEETGIRAHLGEAFFASQGPEGGRGPCGSRSTIVGRLTAGSRRPSRRMRRTRSRTRTLPRRPSWPASMACRSTSTPRRTSTRRRSASSAGASRRSRSCGRRVSSTPTCSSRTARASSIVTCPFLEGATGRVAVASAPRGYLKFAWPTTTPVRALREMGLDVGLATDGAASNGSLDVWESMGLSALIQKSTTGDPRWLTSRQALHHATLQSASAVGLGESIGSLAPGRRADIILVDLTGPHTQPGHDLAATLVHSARSSDVRTTIVDGRVLMRDRELLTIDVQAVVTEMAEQMPTLLDRSHATRRPRDRARHQGDPRRRQAEQATPTRARSDAAGGTGLIRRWWSHVPPVELTP
jgi:5-methylthioadenosine/S-adenosylhomocysteine deaminase